VDATAYLALEHNQLTPGAAFSASSRLFDLKIEASRFRKKNISAAIVADVKRFCYAKQMRFSCTATLSCLARAAPSR
jgi:hypothetical protein